jgi:aryl-alcohol dehydrogenase-like predicted oxidoreductase
MQYTRLGNSGLIISRMAFVVVTFGHDDGKIGAVWKTGRQKANAPVERSLDAGINFFDTAHCTRTGFRPLRPARRCAMRWTQTDNREVIHGKNLYPPKRD